jgi:hypothetical protein
MDFRRTYRAAAVSFADLADGLPLDGRGLGDWSLRDLVGHTVSSAIRQVPEVLAAPADAVAIDSPESYWALARSAPAELMAGHRAASTADAHATGAALGPDTVAELVGQATAALAAAGDDDVVTTPAGGMRVRDWLPTRTFELVVHGLDVAAAAGRPFDLPEPVLAEAATLAARVAVTVGDGPAVLRALTGRGPLPDGFTVVG